MSIKKDGVKSETNSPESIPSTPLVPATPVVRKTQTAYSPLYTGRSVITTNETVISAGNVIEVLRKAMVTHSKNKGEINYLFNYEKGKQPILGRQKTYHEEVCNCIVINHATEIVKAFSSMFIVNLLGYVSLGANEKAPEMVSKLNGFMRLAGKSSKDYKLIYWVYTCGIGYRLTLNEKVNSWEELDEAPFEIETLDPHTSFVVRSNDSSKKVLMGVKYTYTGNEKSNVMFTVYTDTERFVISGSEMDPQKIVEHDYHRQGYVPITEYILNPNRMGVFESVLSLLDAINLTESNRLDGIEQFIQALMVMENVDLDRTDFQKMKELGAIMLPNIEGRPSKVYYLNEQLDQSQTQNLIDDMYHTVLQIVGLPAPGNSSTSDSSNNGAALIKSGTYNASVRMNESKVFWEDAEMEFLKLILKICRDADSSFSLKASEIQTKFGLLSYTDLQTRVQSFTSLIGVGAPSVQAFTLSELSSDPQSDAIVFDKAKEEREKKMEEQMQRSNSVETIVSEDEEDDQDGEETSDEVNDARN